MFEFFYGDLIVQCVLGRSRFTGHQVFPFLNRETNQIEREIDIEAKKTCCHCSMYKEREKKMGLYFMPQLPNKRLPLPQYE